MRYIIYARKSTEEEDRQVLSVEVQLVELKEFAAKEKLEIVKVRGEPRLAGRAAKSRGLVFAACGGENGSRYFKNRAPHIRGALQQAL